MRNESNILIHNGHLPNYFKEIQNSVFCFDAPGFGFSVRILDYMANGCIPVIISQDMVWPFEWNIDYSHFSLRFAKSEIPTIASRLRSLSKREVFKLQHGVNIHHKKFLWDANYGEAYKTTIHILKQFKKL